MSLSAEEIAGFKAYRRNPLAFVVDILQVPQVSAQQKQGCEEVRKLVTAKLRVAGYKWPWRWEADQEEQYSKKVGLSIMAGQGPGKDAFAAWMIIWMLTCFPFSKIPCTAPTGHQLKDILWAELNKWLRKSKLIDPKDPTNDWLTWQSEKLFFTESKGREWFAVARTSNPKATAEEQAETLAGFHEDYLMVVIDEGSRVADPVYKPLEGTLTGKMNFILLLFNPTRSQGYAFDTQFKDRDRWICLRWDAEESEIVSKDHIDFMAKKYGRDSNTFRVRVKGLPPKTGDRVLVEYDWAIDAVERDLIALPSDPEVFGLDVGAGVDDTVLYRRCGPIVYPVEILNTPDSEVVIGWILKRLMQYEPEMLLIDIIGVGWAIEGALRRRCHNIEIIGVNVADAAAEDDRFHRLRDELLWKLRVDFEKQAISIPDDALLIGEMTSIHYDDERPDGKTKIESKKDLRKRGIESPNRLDALALTYYYDWEIMRRMTGRHKEKLRQSPGLNWKTL